MNDIYVKTENLSKRFLVLRNRETTFRTLKALIKNEPLREELWVLKNISFEIKKGEKIALIGKNGSGKTTLLRILTDIYSKTSGYLKISATPSALFRFWIGLNMNLSVIDNIYLFGAVHGIKKGFLKSNLNKILETAELGYLRFSLLKELSDGQMQRVAMSVFFQVENDFLIFDESLEFVDKSFAQKCEIYFKKLFYSDKTLVITSHDTSFLRKYCNRAIWLDKGLIRMSGGIDEVIKEYEQFLRV